MKRLFATTFIFLSLTMYSQEKEYRVGDTIYFKERVSTPHKNSATFYAILKSKEMINRRRLYKMEGYKIDTDSINFYKQSSYYSIEPNVLSSDYKHVNFHKNGQKASEGLKKSNRNYGNWQFWYKNGQKKEESIYFKRKKLLRSKMKYPEIISFWDKNGNQTITNGNGSYLHIKDSTIVKGFYKNKVRHGKFTATVNNREYYEEYYQKGILINGKSWDKEGNMYSYNETFSTPKFPRGQKGINKHVVKHFKIPQYALDNKISGRMVVGFKINKDGSLSNFKVLKKLCPPCDEEALRVVKLMKKWKPGKVRGKKVRVGYSLPIKYNIE